MTWHRFDWDDEASWPARLEPVLIHICGGGVERWAVAWITEAGRHESFLWDIPGSLFLPQSTARGSALHWRALPEPPNGEGDTP